MDFNSKMKINTLLKQQFTKAEQLLVDSGELMVMTQQLLHDVSLYAIGFFLISLYANIQLFMFSLLDFRS